MNPLLSICIPTYNRHNRLDKLLESLALQLQEARLEGQVEIVISDNHSKDNTQLVGEKWAARHSFIHYFRNPWNIGGDPNHLRVVERGTGHYAWILGDDDRVCEGGIARVFSHLIPGVSQLFLNFRCVDPEGNCVLASRLNPATPDSLITLELIKRVGFMSVFALISTHVFDREKFLATDASFLLKLSPWYVLNTAMLIAFHDQPCHIVHEPIIDYTIGNERLPPETATYGRILQLLETLKWLEENNKIDEDFLYGCYESGSHGAVKAIYFREEIYNSLIELSLFWALPGRKDWKLIREFVDRGPGFWALRDQLKSFFVDHFEAYIRHKRPTIHYWNCRAWFPAFSLLLATDDPKEVKAFDQLAGLWPEEFAHESILISNLPEEEVSLKNVDVFMAPSKRARSPSSALNTGFRKALAPRVLILNQVSSPAITELIKKIDDWDAQGNAPRACLLFAPASSEGTGLPGDLLGLYVEREYFMLNGGFENEFETWPRDRLLADAALRLGCEAREVNGGKISPEALSRWFAAQLPAWFSWLRSVRKRPLSEHGLNRTVRKKALQG